MLGICERFGQLPSAVEREPATLFRLLAIERMGNPEKTQDAPVIPEGGGW